MPACCRAYCCLPHSIAARPPNRTWGPQAEQRSSQLKTRSMIWESEANSASGSCSLAPKCRTIDAEAAYMYPSKVLPPFKDSLFDIIPQTLLVESSNLILKALLGLSTNQHSQNDSRLDVPPMVYIGGKLRLIAGHGNNG
jgi:hypothetical protein